MEISTKIQMLHNEQVRFAKTEFEFPNKGNYRTFYGRAEGLEIAMKELGISFDPISEQSKNWYDHDDVVGNLTNRIDYNARLTAINKRVEHEGIVFSISRRGEEPNNLYVVKEKKKPLPGEWKTDEYGPMENMERCIKYAEVMVGIHKSW